MSEEEDMQTIECITLDSSFELDTQPPPADKTDVDPNEPSCSTVPVKAMSTKATEITPKKRGPKLRPTGHAKAIKRRTRTSARNLVTKKKRTLNEWEAFLKSCEEQCPELLLESDELPPEVAETALADILDDHPRIRRLLPVVLRRFYEMTTIIVSERKAGVVPAAETSGGVVREPARKAVTTLAERSTQVDLTSLKRGDLARPGVPYRIHGGARIFLDRSVQTSLPDTSRRPEPSQAEAGSQADLTPMTSASKSSKWKHFQKLVNVEEAKSRDLLKDIKNTSAVMSQSVKKPEKKKMRMSDGGKENAGPGAANAP